MSADSKSKACVFVAIFVVVLSVIPTVNFVADRAAGAPLILREMPAQLTRTDFLVSLVDEYLFTLGISTDPGQAVVGRHGWIFLGDDVDSVFSMARSGCPTDRAQGERAREARLAWAERLAGMGILGPYVFVGPNKHTVYREFLPEWAQLPRCPEADRQAAQKTRALESNLFELAGDLQSARERHDHLLYYKTDTHWNQLGAWEAYRGMARRLEPIHPELNFVADNDAHINGESARGGGDLSGFLFLADVLVENEPIVSVTPAVSTRTRRYPGGEFEDQPWNGHIQVGSEPVLVESTGALNSMRVLWLRDSFGVHLSPYIAATFSSVLQAHWPEALSSPESLMTLIDAYRPELVIVTVVERSALDDRFAQGPPPATD